MAAGLLALRDVMAVAAIGTVLLFVICPRCLRGLLYQIRYQATVWQGESYLLGEYSDKGFPHYFAAALMIKVALPVLVMLVLLLLFRPRYLLSGAILAAVGLLALTPAFRIQTGVRYVLPVAALALVGASAGLGGLWNEPAPGPRRGSTGVLAIGLILWSLVCCWQIWPNGICYTNEPFGGTRQGHLALTESNIDWGQGLNELKHWQQSHADGPLYLWYFGTDPRCMNQPFHPLTPSTLESGEDLKTICAGGYLAASKSYVYGYYHDTPAARYLRTLEPMDQTSTHLIYDFRWGTIRAAKP